MFPLTDEQMKKAQAWMNEQVKKKITRDCTGFQFGYCFYPTTLGLVVKIVDVINKEELDITDMDDI